MTDLKIRIKWSDFEYYKPVRIIISDWKHLVIIRYGRKDYMSVDCKMEYGGHDFELLVPYALFVKKLQKLSIQEQELIVENKAIIEIEKTYKMDGWGMRIRKVENFLEYRKKLSSIYENKKVYK